MNKLLSKHILKQSIRNNWKLWTIMTGVLCFFIIVITFSMTNRGDMDDRGMQMFSQSMEQIYASAFFGTSGMGMILMLIFAITAGNKLVAGEIDRGTMSFTLNTPTTRKQIIFSKALFYVISIFLMVIAMGLSGTFASFAAGADINVGKLWLVILGCLLFSFATSGICFFASCWFNKSGQSLMIGAGLPVTFFLLSSLSSLIKISDKEFLKYFSMNTLLDTTNILTETNFIAQFIVMGAIGLVLHTVGIYKFLKKDLPI